MCLNFRHFFIIRYIHLQKHTSGQGKLNKMTSTNCEDDLINCFEKTNISGVCILLYNLLYLSCIHIYIIILLCQNILNIACSM